MHPTGLPTRFYDLVVADPAWPFVVRGQNGHGKSPEAHYRTMPLAEIEALRVGELLRPGGLMLLWGTGPLLDRQISILRAWGLDYVSFITWAKRTRRGRLRWGPGYNNRTVCEPILMAVAPGRQATGWIGRSLPNLLGEFDGELIDGLAREHSRKPEEFYRRIEAASPGARRADIFAREIRPGWDGFGDELGKFAGRAA